MERYTRIICRSGFMLDVMKLYQKAARDVLRLTPKSQFGNHNTKRIMIIDGICIIPTSPKIVYRDLRDRCVTDYCI